MATLFVSDLHLDPARPAITALFLDFLERQAGRANACTFWAICSRRGSAMTTTPNSGGRSPAR
jgi:hypothetical protein